ncbi:hypothetical protein [Desulfofundulus thermobenzoicus]|nr:hypothetical protein [Desulfofundulus thermobenzoicus]
MNINWPALVPVGGLDNSIRAKDGPLVRQPLPAIERRQEVVDSFC